MSLDAGAIVREKRWFNAGTVLLGMSLNFFHSVSVAHDLEVEAPSAANATVCQRRVGIFSGAWW
jgi:hypothetical protein